MVAYLFVFALIGWLAVPLSAPLMANLFKREGIEGLRKRLIPVGGTAAILALVIWGGASLIWPWIDHRGDWIEVQRTYERWQALNVGMIALTASIVAFFAANLRFSSEERRNKEAAQAFIPEALSALSDYIDGCMQFLDDGYWFSRSRHGGAPTPPRSRRTTAGLPSGPPGMPPLLPEAHRPVFAENFRYAPEVVTKQLKLILADLQIFDSNVRALANAFFTRPNAPHHHNIRSYLLRLAIIKARVDRLYDYGRPGSVYDDRPIDAAELRSKLRVSGVDVDRIDGIGPLFDRYAVRANREDPYAPPPPLQ